MKLADLETTDSIDEAPSPDAADMPSLPSRTPAKGSTIGTLVGIARSGEVPLVTYAGQSGAAAIAAKTAVDLHEGHVGSSVVLTFEDDDPNRPIVVGRLKTTAQPIAQRQPSTLEIEIDGERVVVAAAEQLVLKCGKASITLTRAGKVLINGTYVATHSSGVNRVKGGSIQLN